MYPWLEHVCSFDCIHECIRMAPNHPQPSNLVQHSCRKQSDEFRQTIVSLVMSALVPLLSSAPPVIALFRRIPFSPTRKAPMITSSDGRRGSIARVALGIVKQVAGKIAVRTSLRGLFLSWCNLVRPEDRASSRYSNVAAPYSTIVKLYLSIRFGTTGSTDEKWRTFGLSWWRCTW
ncbi:hypothetical protein EJ04DRAFT_12854 [Polyplosphaeria fusca]|uniref:Uncharacterized protein n=1 Tax=Polyplosphaeria fusca TaxID=682080 RepID=A0A9P4UZR8_9PLEO|nr:hypothetical protein EJ04DRAFT_12854 [Polyplosphaeria fusca]